MTKINSKRIALLGNSHASAIKIAWDDLVISDLSIDLTFFARPNGRGGLNGLTLNGAVLVPEDPDLQKWFLKTSGLSEIVLDDYDGFWVYGFGPDHRRTSRMAKDLSEPSLSKSLMKSCVAEFKERLIVDFRGSSLFRLTHLLRSATNKPIYVSGKPLLGESYIIARQGLITLNAGEAVFDAFCESLESLFSELNAVLIPQPSETVSCGCFTRRDMVLKDGKHMNSLYGLQMIRSCMAVSN